MSRVRGAGVDSISDESGIGVTPAPSLANLEGTDDRMLGRPGVLAGVRVLRLITAADIATAETEAEMDPGVSHCHALTATLTARFHLPDQVEVRAGW